MHELMELKEMLCRELEEYGRKGELSKTELEFVDKLAQIVKNLGKIIEMGEEEEYSGASYARGGRGGRGGSNRGGSNRGGSYEGSYEGGSYARGGRGRERNSRGQYSREQGYSRDDDFMDGLYDLMEEAPEHKRKELERFIKKIEQM